MSQQQLTTFVWLEGQLDNLGDSVLRRGYADALAVSGPLRVWAGHHADDYVSGLGLRDSDTVSVSFSGWLTSLYLSVLRGNARLALNAGEFGMSRQYAIRILGLLPAIFMCRMLGGKVIWLGAGVPKTRRGFAWPLKLMALCCTHLRWRDVESGSMIRPAQTMPDWAFAVSAGKDRSANGRNRLSIVLRGDRPPPSEEWINAVKQVSVRLDLRLTVVVQVARDESRGAETAERLGAELVPWSAESHGVQEAIVRVTYQESKLVLSDRLHALIMAITEGCVALGWCESTTDKIRRHLEVVGLSAMGRVDGPAEKLMSFTATELKQLTSVTAVAQLQATERLSVIRSRLNV